MYGIFKSIHKFTYTSLHFTINVGEFYTLTKTTIYAPEKSTGNGGFGASPGFSATVWTFTTSPMRPSAFNTFVSARIHGFQSVVPWHTKCCLKSVG